MLLNMKGNARGENFRKFVHCCKKYNVETCLKWKAGWRSKQGS